VGQAAPSILDAPAAPSILDAPAAVSFAAVKLLGATPVNSWAGLASVILRKKNSLVNASWAAGL
jgi:hypothetical protein